LRGQTAPGSPAPDRRRDRQNRAGAFAVGDPLGATGARLALAMSRQLRREGLRYGVASACIGGGRGVAMVVENPAVAI
jgi:acetyl-CoA C-acetyltransferase